MKKLTILLFLVAVFPAAFAQNSQIIKDYIATYRDIAIDEMIRTGVPASITLAQGIHETSAGQSVLVRKSNNHFGIKCKSDWKGASVSHDDDAKGECFRKYDDPYESYRDHSDFLKTRAHYAFLFKLDPTDYEGWCHGLKKAGYATNPKYPQILIKLIRDYNLQDYTMVALERMNSGDRNIILTGNNAYVNESSGQAKTSAVQVEKSAYPAGIFEINGTKVVLVQEGSSYLAIAEEHNLSLAKLFDFNDMKPADIADRDHLLFLQRKKKAGQQEFHVVGKGEDLHHIAQVYGIRMESLLEYNKIPAASRLAEGSKIYLKGPAPEQAARQTSSSLPEKNILVTHTVQPKETLYSISKRYEISVEDLMKWNGLDSTELKQGQQLKIYKKEANVGSQG